MTAPKRSHITDPQPGDAVRDIAGTVRVVVARHGTIVWYVTQDTGLDSSRVPCFEPDDMIIHLAGEDAP